MDPPASRWRPPGGRLPRLRGDGPFERYGTTWLEEAAPPTRGWTPLPHIRCEARQGCPAYAGMDLLLSSTCPAGKRLPRLRGDGPVAAQASDWAYSAAPPTRGWTLMVGVAIASAMGCPAYAGMDRGRRRCPSNGYRLPRLRGGWTRRRSLEPTPYRGCPAYAGMDPGK